MEKSVEEAIKNKDVSYLCPKEKSIILYTIANEILIRKWEIIGVEGRKYYQKKEEEDRERFVNEEDIKSAVCSSITRRKKPAKSQGPNKNLKQISEEDRG
uniref:Uncharacterized protein n=1 Tax=Corethron hystrix TaxID=216773 RepID=A0A7S1BCQ7_9STRA|mmetsp:Transcript_21164/g.48048  ORF Transcript_21164/g.48048 Transcript_21164/m.48048 type:complete len:100 (+) Transcript_21164:715-1014(+)